MTKINSYLYGPIAAGAVVVLMILLMREAMAILNFSMLYKLQKFTQMRQLRQKRQAWTGGQTGSRTRAISLNG